MSSTLQYLQVSARKLVNTELTVKFTNLRHFHNCGCLRATNVVYRQSRMLKKLMTGSSNSRKKFYTVDQPVSKTLTEFNSARGGARGVPVKSNKVLRRVEVLNTLFMEQITSLMSTGEASPEIVGLGITVCKVKISNDFSRVNVYWVATGTEKDNVIEPLLRKAGGILRHELSQLRVIGIVPPIEFVKDKTYSKVIEVQTLLDKCDFGEDFVPTSSTRLFAQSSQPQLSNTTGIMVPVSENSVAQEEDSSKQKDVLEKPDNIVSETELYKYVPIRQDMLGLQYDVIVSEIKQMMKKVRVKQQPANDATFLSSEEISDQNFSEVNQMDAESIISRTKAQVAVDKERKDDFLKYLRKQQLARAKELKRESTAMKEKEFYEDEAFDRWKTRVFGEDFENEDENDYNQDDFEYEESYYNSQYEVGK